VSVPHPESSTVAPWARVLLFTILVLAAILRFTGLSWGLRHPPHSDERGFVAPVVAMVKAHDLDHRWYQYPGLFIYLLAPGVALLGPARWDGPDAYLACRAVVAGFGVLNVALLYAVARRVVGIAGALAAALLLAASPLDVQTSHQVRADVVLQTTGILAILALRRVGDGLRGDWMMGCVIGLAAATKFTGVLLVPAYLVARTLSPGRRVLGLLVVGLLTVTIPIACTPYSLIHWRQYLGVGLTGPATYNTLSGGPVTYYAGEHHFFETSRFLLEGIASTLGPLGVALAALGLVIGLRTSWRSWVPPLVHPVTILVVMAPAAIMYQRHMLPGTGVFYVLAAAAVESIARRSAWGAAALAIAAAVSPLRASADYVVKAARPSGEDRALDWIAAHMAAGSRILETRPDAVPGARPGAQMGVDPNLYEFMTYSPSEFRPGLRLVAPEFDLVITGPGAGRGWSSGLETVYEARGPGGGLVLQLKVPRRVPHVPVALSQALLSASCNRQGLAAAYDNDPRTSWSTATPLRGDEWIQIDLQKPLSLARVEVFLGEAPRGPEPDLRVLVKPPGDEWRPIRAFSGRPPVTEQRAAIRPLSQVLLFDSQPVDALRIVQVGRRDYPWVVSELRVDALGREETLEDTARDPALGPGPRGEKRAPIQPSRLGRVR